jgi:hypothetical protein
MRILTQRNSTSAQSYHGIKNKHWSIWAKLTPATIFLILYFIIALLIALHIDFPLLDIVSDLLHICMIVLLITFSYTMHLRNYQKELYTSFYCHSHFSYLCSIRSSIFALNSREVIKSPSHLKSKKYYRLLLITSYLIVDFKLDYLSCTSSLLYQNFNLITITLDFDTIALAFVTYIKYISKILEI